MNTLIYVLEGLTALLVLLLLFQVARYYRASAPASVSVEQSPASPPPVSISKPRPAEFCPREPATGGSEAILNDYIGGFFADTVSDSADIQAFKAPVSPLFVEKKPVEWDADEVEDDSVITVIPTASNEAGGAPEKVMTDKVVHAMLDEAKLVCAS